MRGRKGKRKDKKSFFLLLSSSNNKLITFLSELLCFFRCSRCRALPPACFLELGEGSGGGVLFFGCRGRSFFFKVRVSERNEEKKTRVFFASIGHQKPSTTSLLHSLTLASTSSRIASTEMRDLSRALWSWARRDEPGRAADDAQEGQSNGIEAFVALLLLLPPRPQQPHLGGVSGFDIRD